MSHYPSVATRGVPAHTVPDVLLCYKRTLKSTYVLQPYHISENCGVPYALSQPLCTSIYICSATHSTYLLQLTLHVRCNSSAATRGLPCTPSTCVLQLLYICAATQSTYVLQLADPVYTCAATHQRRPAACRTHPRPVCCNSSTCVLQYTTHMCCNLHYTCAATHQRRPVACRTHRLREHVDVVHKR